VLSMEELKEIASIEQKDAYFVSLYLNVDPLFNKKGDYTVHLKNMIKNTAETLDKNIYKRVKRDIEKIDNYVLSNKRLFRKGLVLLSSTEGSFWKEYHLGVPVKNDLIVDKTPYTKHLIDLLDTYRRYMVLLVEKDSARIFVIHLGEIIEYGEVHTPDIPGKHKKGGWFALSQSSYERHIDYHVKIHLKDVLAKLGAFYTKEHIRRIIIGGSDEAVSMVKGMLSKPLLERVIGTVKIEMIAKSDDVLRKAEQLVAAFEKKKQEETIESLITGAMKIKDAALGVEDVLNALQEQRVMKLIFIKDLRLSGYSCGSCGFLTTQNVTPCPYCKGKMEFVDYIVNLAGEKAIQQGALVEVVTENKKLQEAGGIGAFLRF